MNALAMKNDNFVFKNSSTVEYIKHLKSANFTEKQIETLAQHEEDRNHQLEQIFEFTAQRSLDKQNLVTNQYLDTVKLELQKEIAIVKLELQKEIEIVKLELQKEIEIVRKEIVQSSNRIIIWTTSLIGGCAITFLGILAKGFHWL